VVWAARPKPAARWTTSTLDYIKAGGENRKMCSLYLSLMDRMGVKLDKFGDADTRLQGV